MGENILTVGAVDDENDFVRGALEGLALCAANAAEFFHKVRLRGQTARGVGNDHVRAAGFTGRNGVKHHGGRVAPALADHVDAVALAPNGELLAGGGAERVGGG